MRLLVVTNVYPPDQTGGYELSCASFVEHLERQDAQVRVLAARAGAHGDRQPAVFRELWSYRSPSGRFVSPGLVNRWRLERLNQQVLLAQVADLRPDAVMWWNMGGLSLSLIERARRIGLPAAGVVCDYWMIWARHVDAWHRAGRRWPTARPLAGGITRVPLAVDLSAAARWVFVSEHLRAETLRRLGPLARTEVVPSGVPTTQFRRRDPSRPWTCQMLMVGRVTENKGVDTALRVLARAPGAQLTIAGSGDVAYVDEMQRLAGVLGVADRVAWLGAQDQERIATLYAEHDVLLFPIRWDEPWGKVPLEAMASGLPVIGSPRGGAGEYLTDGENCLTAMTEDQFIEALARLGSGPCLRAELIAGGDRTVAGYDVAWVNARRQRALEMAVHEGAGRPGPLSAVS